VTNFLDPRSLLETLGALGVFGVLFAETGLLIGFFLPGDSLLFTAGLLAAAPAGAALHLDLTWVLVAAVAGAVLGAQTGYLIGRRAGPALLAGRPRPRLQQGVERTRVALERYGVARALVLARFVPVVRTVAGPVAGMLRVPARTYLVWQLAGGVVWAAGLTLLGYALGTRISGVDRYLLPIVAVIVAVSLLPAGLELVRSRRH
jgi:membrane-associated protein